MSLADILAALEALLRDEQAAVAAFDVGALEGIAAAKAEAGARLRELAGARGLGAAAPAVRAAAARVTALAEANAALLTSSVTAIAETLGVRMAPGTYDSRARLRQHMRSAGTRVL